MASKTINDLVPDYQSFLDKGYSEKDIMKVAKNRLFNEINKPVESKVSLPLGDMKPPPPPLVKERTWGEAGTDTLKQLASGAGGLVQTAGDLQMLIEFTHE